MKIPLLIAADSFRALFHQRLILALILALLGLTAVFSGIASQATERMREQSEMMAGPEGGQLDEAEREDMRRGMDVAQAFFLAVFYWFAALGGTLVTLYLCCTAVAADLRRGTIRMILSKPVSRTQFLLGKYAGAIVIMACYSALTGLALAFHAGSNGLDLSVAARFAPWLMFCHNLMIGSVALCLSLLVHPLLAAVVAFFASAGFVSAPNPLYYILPSYDRLNVFDAIMGGLLVSTQDVLLLTAYALDVAAIFLLLALWRFRSKELLD